MNASLIAAAGLMLAVVSAPAQNATKIQYRTPVTEATPLGFTLNLQSRPGGEGHCHAPARPSVVIVSSLGGTSYRGTYYRQPVAYVNSYPRRLTVSGYTYGYGYGHHRPLGWTGHGAVYATGGGSLHCGTVAVQPSYVRTVVVRPCVY